MELDPNASEWTPPPSFASFDDQIITNNNNDAAAYLPEVRQVADSIYSGDLKTDEREDVLPLLMALFPEVLPELLQNQLLKPYDSVQALIYDLLAATDAEIEQNDALEDVPRQQQQSVQQTQNQKEVCRYFLQGICRIRNCEFLHSDVHRTALCRYWLSGFCSRGDQCAYRHELPQVDSTKYNLHSQNDTVASSVQPKQPQIWQQLQQNASSSGLAAKMALSQLKRDFGDVVHVDVIANVWRTNHQQSDAARRALVQLCGGKSPHRQSQQLSSLSSSMQMAQVPSSRVDRRQIEARMSRDPIRYWASSGTDVASLYANQRADAQRIGNARNALFDKAAEAFRRGNHAQARQLAQEGHQLNRQMHQLHNDASNRIVMARNDHGDSFVLDVHGLHADEAWRLVQQRLRQLKISTNKRGASLELMYLDVIVGSGQHSRRRSRGLQDLLVEYLKEDGQIFVVCDAAGHGGGMLRIYVSGQPKIIH